MIYKLINILLIISTFTLYCKKDPRDIAKEDLDKEMKPSRIKLEAYKKKPIYWNASVTDKDQCIIQFLESINKSTFPSVQDCFVETKEWEESFLPYVYGQGTLLDSTPLEKYLQITEERRLIGIEKIASLIRNKTFKIIKIQWNKNEKSNLEPFVGWKPVITLLINRNTFVINEIKQVIEYNGTYKIAVIAP